MKQQRIKYGLIGYPLSHSFSPGYFTEKYKKLGIENTEYKAYPIDDINKVCGLVDSGISGFNVTIPYKEQVIPFLDDISEEAKSIGAVNTIKVVDGKLIGYNTDVYGFEESLKSQLGNAKIKKALILGTGGASKAVFYVLKKMGIEPTLVSRRAPHLTYDDLSEDIMSSHNLIVNTTPLGMSPNYNSCPSVPYDFLTEKHFLYDLVYNPEKSLFLKNGESQHCNIKNGYDMLILQAERSFEIWNTK